VEVLRSRAWVLIHEMTRPNLMQRDVKLRGAYFTAARIEAPRIDLARPAAEEMPWTPPPLPDEPAPRGAGALFTRELFANIVVPDGEKAAPAPVVVEPPAPKRAGLVGAGALNLVLAAAFVVIGIALLAARDGECVAIGIAAYLGLWAAATGGPAVPVLRTGGWRKWLLGVNVAGLLQAGLVLGIVLLLYSQIRDAAPAAGRAEPMRKDYDRRKAQAEAQIKRAPAADRARLQRAWDVESRTLLAEIQRVEREDADRAGERGESVRERRREHVIVAVGAGLMAALHALSLLLLIRR